MSEFKNKSITTKGMELLSKALAGDPLEFTRIELGDGRYEGDLGFTEALVSMKQNLAINNLNRNGSQVTLSAVLKVEDIRESFNWSEIGIYAKGADNIEDLYMYGYTENTSYISKDSLNEKLIHVTVMVSNAAQITATVNDSLIYLTAESLAAHNMDTFAHEEIRESIVLLKEAVGNISWEEVNDKPLEYPPSIHNHDEQYYTESEVDTKLQEINARLESFNPSPIKSIQRGVSNMPYGVPASVGVTISAVDPDKCMVLINGNVPWDAERGCDVYLKSLTATKITFSCIKQYISNATYPFSWQLIEFK